MHTQYLAQRRSLEIPKEWNRIGDGLLKLVFILEWWGGGVGIELKPFPWVGMDTFLNTHKRQSGPLKKNLVGSINYLKMDDFIT